MPEKNVDLHGSAPDKHKFALLLIDVINDPALGLMRKFLKADTRSSSEIVLRRTQEEKRKRCSHSGSNRP